MSKNSNSAFSDLTFVEFFYIWASQDFNNWEVPEFHYKMMEFLDQYDDWINNTGVLQIFRGAGKSTMLGLYVVYRLVKDPTLRFLIMSADHLTAQKITEDCRNIITRHPLSVHLYNNKLKWMANRFSVLGSTDARNPSVAAYGVMSNYTGSRADFVIFDDVEVPKNCDSDAKREMLRTRIMDTSHILVPNTGRRLFVGTPHTFESIYPEMIRDDEHGIQKASYLTLEAYTEWEGEFPNITGTPRWPDRFNGEVLKLRQLESTKGNFYSQYLLKPMSTEDSRLDPKLAIVYDNDVEFFWSNGTQYAKLGNYALSTVSAYWDPSLARTDGDSSVLAIVFSSDMGHYFIHRLYELEGDANEQCQKVREYLVEYQVPVVSVETNGLGGFLPPLLLSHLKGTGIGVDGHFEKKKKSLKLIEAYETPLSAGLIHISREVADSPFYNQMRDFNPRVWNQKNDFIDAPASAILKEPIRIGSSPVNDGNQSMNDSISLWGDYSNNENIEIDYSSIA